MDLSTARTILENSRRDVYDNGGTIEWWGGTTNVATCFSYGTDKPVLTMHADNTQFTDEEVEELRKLGISS
jgi:hypothetical protein